MSLAPAQVHARLVAFPFASEEAFQACASTLPKSSESTKRLEGRAVVAVQDVAGGLSIDQLTQWRRIAWEKLTACRDLLEAFQCLAREHLEEEGAALRIRAGRLPDGRTEESPAAFHRWANLTQELPASLLVLAWPHARGGRPRLDMPIQRLVERGVTEQHSHLGSAKDFIRLWSDVQCQFANGKGKPPELKKPEIEDRLVGQPADTVFAAAAVARAALSHWSRRADLLGVDWELEDWYKGHPERRTAKRVLDWVLRQPDAGDLPTAVAVRMRLESLLRHPEREEVLQGRLWGLVEANRLSPVLRCLLLQYLRLTVWTWRWLVLPLGTGGFDWFRVSYRRVGTLGDLIVKDEVSHAVEVEGRGVKLGSIEWRIMPPTRKKQTHPVDYVRQAVAVQRKKVDEQPEMGFVLHFAKPDDDNKRDPRILRYGPWLEENVENALLLASALERMPELLVFWRGVDLCNRELALPLWPALLPLSIARRASEEASRALLRRRAEWGEVPPFRTSIHMGEECRHLQDGFRRVVELLDFGQLQVGDRIGHGMALGTEVRVWLERFDCVVTPRGERLDDLLWEWSVYAAREASPVAARIVWLEAEILRLGREIHRADDVTVAALIEARRRIHDVSFLRRIWRSGGGSRRPPDVVTRLAQATVMSKEVGDRLVEPIRVERHDSDRAALESLQRYARARLAAHSITVEANPSSNLAIGDLGEIARHPMFHLQPLPNDKEDRPASLAVSINCDNLLVSDTNLGQEYNKVWKALLRAGHSSDDALDWLDRARRAGWDARFTLPQSRNSRVLDWFHDHFQFASKGSP